MCMCAAVPARYLSGLLKHLKLHILPHLLLFFVPMACWVSSPQLVVPQAGLKMSTDRGRERERLQASTRTARLQPCQHRVGKSAKLRSRPARQKGQKTGQRRLRAGEAFQHVCPTPSIALGNVRLEDKHHRLQSTDTCSIPGTHRSDVSSSGRIQTRSTLERCWTGSRSSSKVDKVQVAIDDLKVQMDSGLSLVEDALQETSNLKAEFTVLQNELQELCSAYMEDDIDAWKSFDKQTHGMGSTRCKKNPEVNNNSEWDIDDAIIDAIEEPGMYHQWNQRTILESVASVETCGSQQFQAASLIASESNLLLEETEIGPVSIQTESPTALTCAIDMEYLCIPEGYVQIPLVSLQSQSSDACFPEHTSCAADEGNCSDFEKGVLDDTSSECSSPYSTCPDLSTQFEGCAFHSILGSNVRNEELEQCLLEDFSELPFSNDGLSMSEIFDPVCGHLAPVEEPLTVVSGRCIFGNNSFSDQKGLYSGEVEVFEHRSCDEIERHAQPPVDSGMADSACRADWMCLDSTLPLGLLCPSSDDCDTVVNQSAGSAWGSEMERNCPVESLILMDIEAQAPRVGSGIWDSARQYQKSKPNLLQMTSGGTDVDRSRHSSLPRQFGAAQDSIDLKTCTSAINFDSRNDGKLPTEEVSQHEVMTPTRVENNNYADSMERCGVWNDTLRTSRKRRSLSFFKSSSCSSSSKEDEECAPLILADTNKLEIRSNRVAGSWLDRMCQGISSLTSGISRNNGSTDDTGLTEEGTQEFELVELNSEDDAERTGANAGLLTVVSTAFHWIPHHAQTLAAAFNTALETPSCEDVSAIS